MFDCVMQNGFEESLDSWKIKFQTGIFEWSEYMVHFIWSQGVLSKSI